MNLFYEIDLDSKKMTPKDAFYKSNTSWIEETCIASSMIAINNQTLLIIGGQSAQTNRMKQIFTIDIITGKLTKIDVIEKEKTMWVGRSFHGCCLWKGNVYLFGGCDNGDVGKILMKLNPNNWELEAVCTHPTIKNAQLFVWKEKLGLLTNSFEVEFYNSGTLVLIVL